MRFCIRGAQVVMQGQVTPADVLIDSGRIAAVAQNIPAFPDVVSLDGSGHCIFPGLVDVHVHFREPGFSYKETMESGTAAAARGGFTAVAAMPNVQPVPDSLETLAVQTARIRAGAAVRVRPYAAITRGEAGRELVDFQALAPHVAGFSDDGRGVQDDAVMRAAMLAAAKTGAVIAAHCEDDSLRNGGVIHEGIYAAAHGLRGIPSACEWKQIERDLALVRETGCKYHICHLSTKEGVALVRRAKAEGLDVTCETAPHYLVLDDRDLCDDGAYKMNPPLRSADDREALVAAFIDGTIDMLATDHAPHAPEEKANGLRGSVMGIPGLETAFAVVYTALVRSGRMPLPALIERMHGAPMRRFAIGTALAAQQPADMTIFSLDTPYAIDPAVFATKGAGSPFAGRTVYGQCMATLVDGYPVWCAPSSRYAELRGGKAQ